MTAKPPQPPAFGRAPPRPPAPRPPPRAPLSRSQRRLRAALGALAAVTVVVVAGFGLAVWQAYLRDLPDLPPKTALYDMRRTPGIRFLDRDGALITARGPRYGDPVRLAQLPEHVPLAFLAAEDRRFYQHGPVDLQAIARAAFVNWRTGEVLQGGSTLTQQLAKDLFLTPEQTFRRKVQEAVMAARLERALTKDEVLELYLNRVFFGANAYGLDGAARTYFDKPAGRLTLAEAALLAALPKAPSRLAPTRNMTGALARSRLVLGEMRRNGWITPGQEAAALAAPPQLTPMARRDVSDFGYALDFATAEVVRLVGADAPPVVVRLSLDPALQRRAAAVVGEALHVEGARARAGQAAVVTLASDGGVRAMVGGRDHEASPFNRAVQARRQPGSAFKPFVYAAALETGVQPGDVRTDSPIRLGPWRPQNYGGGYSGSVSVETALARSINTVAVRLAQEAGGARIGDLAARFGFTTLPAVPDLSVALGAYEVSVLQMAAGYAVFQNAGGRVDPWIVAEVRTLDGRPLYVRPPGAPVPVYEPQRAAQMVRMMRKVITSGTGTRAALDRPAAGKTGTSQNWRDAWFAGFTPDFTTVVWVGDDQARAMDRVTGGALPADIWRTVMLAAHQGLPVRDFDWAAPPPPPPAEVPEAGPREQFYQDLAADFAQAERAADGEDPGG